MAIDEVNARLSRAESIRASAVLPVDFTVTAGELTPTLKVRRTAIEERYEDTIEDLYTPAT